MKLTPYWYTDITVYLITHICITVNDCIFEKYKPGSVDSHDCMWPTMLLQCGTHT